ATDTPAPVVLATATPTACELADLNGSGTVDIFDVRLLARVYGSESGDDDYDAALDFDNSGTINVLDLRRITSQFGQVCATG
ncbi:MAG TPA: dockerin type I domain-containing protein, partial [Spirillospora sp.]|nr:dockerin type I domain-containing protein [Spirillospora sp.]